MASDSNKVLETIQNYFNDNQVLVKVTKPPFFISRFLPDIKDKDIILVYKNNSNVNDTILGVDVDDCNDTHLGDVTGNPLESPFNETFNLTIDVFDYRKAYIEHYPVPVAIARYALGICNTDLKPKLPVWMLTSSRFAKKTVLIGSEREGDYIKIYGVETKKEIMSIPPLVELIMIHRSGTDLKEAEFNCKFSSVYNVHSERCSEDSSELITTTEIKVTWKSKTLEPPLGSCVTEILTQCKIGCGNSGLSFFWNELLLINSLIKIIKSGNQDEFSAKIKPTIFCLQSLMSERQLPISDLKFNTPDIQALKIVSSSLTIKNVLDSYLSGKRTGLDATDKLWYILIDNGSDEESISRIISDVAEMAENNQLPVKENNISRLAASLSSSNDDSIRMISSLKHFVEVGLEKLRKEVFDVLSKTVKMQSFSLNAPQFTNFRYVKRSDWASTAESCLNWMSQMYCCFQLLSNTNEALRIPGKYIENTISTMYAKVLQHFTNDKSSFSVDFLCENVYQEFTWHVNTEVLTAYIKNCPPDVWSLEVCSKSHDQEVTSVFMKSSWDLFPFQTSTNISHNNNFYWSEMHSVKCKTS